jgi:hypothetical protein
MKKIAVVLFAAVFVCVGMGDYLCHAEITHGWTSDAHNPELR